MTNNIKNICVYASSSNDLAKIYYDEAEKLGTAIGQAGYNLVYGGSRRGLMYACASAVRKNGGKIIGIMPERIAQMGCANPEDCDEFIMTKGMRERKALLDERSEAAIAIAGGFGTLEEISEIIVQKQLGYNNKPIVILNTENFYNGLIIQFEEMIRQNFANKKSTNLYHISTSVEDVIDYINNYIPEKYESKFVLNNA